MRQPRPRAMMGMLGSFLIHAALFAAVTFFHVPRVPQGNVTIPSHEDPNAMGPGFPGHLFNGPGPGALSDIAPLNGPTGPDVPAAAARTNVIARIASNSLRQVSLRRLEPTFDYSRWTPAGVAWHLVESTLMVMVVWLFGMLLRRNPARIRYALWLTASMKFFLPLSSLVGLGAAIGIGLPLNVRLASAFDPAVTGSFWSASLLGAPTGGAALAGAGRSTHWLVPLAAMGWLLGSVAVVGWRLRLWTRVRAVLRASKELTVSGLEVPSGVEVRTAAGLLEPGVVGWRRPILLLPDALFDHLQPAELATIVAHESCHVRRRDNLTAALHMMTETVFWFHPAVWMIGGRLLEERERACDEAVLREGHAPTAYARAIVKTCAMCITSPVACVAGVTGSAVSARINEILQDRPYVPIDRWKLAALVLTLVGITAGPVGYGVLAAAPRPPQAIAPPVAIPTESGNGGPMFDAASIRPNNSGVESGSDSASGGRYTVTNLPLAVVIRFAYTPSGRSRDLEPFEVSGGPEWLLSERFDINATAGRDASVSEIRSMVRNLLAERFHVKAHVEQRMGPVFRLSLSRPGRLGPQLRRSEADCSAATGPGNETGRARALCGFFGPSPSISVNSDRALQAMRGMSMDQFAVLLSAYLGRRVINDTGLAGSFDGELEFTAEIALPPPPNGPNPFDGRALPSIFSVLPDQLGLRLQQTTGPSSILVIDRAEHPTPN